MKDMKTLKFKEDDLESCIDLKTFLHKTLSQEEINSDTLKAFSDNKNCANMIVRIILQYARYKDCPFRTLEMVGWGECDWHDDYISITFPEKFRDVPARAYEQEIRLFEPFWKEYMEKYVHGFKKQDLRLIFKDDNERYENDLEKD